MATVTNTSASAVDVPIFGLIFGPGETQEVADELAGSLGAPFEVSGLPASALSPTATPDGTTPAAPAQPSGAVERPAEVEHIDTPVSPAAPEGESK